MTDRRTSLILIGNLCHCWSAAKHAILYGKSKLTYERTHTMFVLYVYDGNIIQGYVLLCKKKFKTPEQKMKETAVFWSSYVTINPKIHFFSFYKYISKISNSMLLISKFFTIKKINKLHRFHFAYLSQIVRFIFLYSNIES